MTLLSVELLSCLVPDSVSVPTARPTFQLRNRDRHPQGKNAQKIKDVPVVPQRLTPQVQRADAMQSPVPSVERGDLSHAETSLAVVLASVSASKNSCAHVTTDHQVSVKTFCGGVEDLGRCHTGPSVRDWRR